MGYGVDYGSTELRLAKAIADELGGGISGGGSGGSGGDASAANQLSQIGLEEDIKAYLASVDLNIDSILTNAGLIKDRLPTFIGENSAANSLSVVLASDSSLPLPLDAASNTNLTSLLARRVNWVNQSGSTSATPSTWTTAIAANANRTSWRIHNPLTNSSGDLLQVGYLIGGTNVRTVILSPGGTIEESLPYSNVSTQAIVVRSTTASLSFDAVEA